MAGEKYKNIVIGSGEGGKYLAWHLARSGEQTVVIERRWIGVPAQISIAFPARMKYGAPKLRILSIMRPGLGPLQVAPLQTWRRSANESGRWVWDSSPRTWTTTRQAAPSLSWARQSFRVRKSWMCNSMTAAREHLRANESFSILGRTRPFLLCSA